MQKFCLTLIFCLLSSFIFAQSKYTISGHVKDSANGEEIVGGSVLIKELSTGAVTNVYGFYSLTLAEGSYTIVFSYIGYRSVERKIDLNQNLTLNIELQSADVQLTEVVIEEKRDDAQEKQISVVKMDVATAKKLPALFGEVDILKTIQLLPGIQSAGEGNSGFFVRGGAADQNLILLDEAPVYNASHLLGFFSVFNPDAIKGIDIYKGGIPARYGGRLSSLLDVRMRDGNSKTFAGTGGLGTISSRLTLEAPLFDQNGSFIVSGRRTYADLFLKLSSNEDIRNNKLYFYDFNIKGNYRIDDKNRIYLSGYFGRDVLNLAGLFGFDWGNATATLRWNHIYNPKLFSNITMIYSNFDYGIQIDLSETQNFELISGIDDIGMKADFYYYGSPKSTIYFGGQSVYHYFQPGVFKPLRDGSIFSRTELPTKNAIESSVYYDQKYQASAKFDIRYGVRLTLFNVLGESTEYTFDPADDYTITDTVSYNQGEEIISYFGPEPRLSISYSINEKNALKASYDHTYQFLHQISNSGTTLPTDLWMPSGLHIKPQISDQFAIGYFRVEKKWEITVEAYYKNMKNQIDYRDNALIQFNPALERELLFGRGWSYGTEFLLQRVEGKVTGWISYTLSKTLREIEGINSGNPYPVKNDRRHNISVVVTWELNPRMSLSGTWVFATGNAVTFPAGRYEFDGEIIPYYPERNSYRMPNYHRGDLSFTLDGKKKEGKKFESSWNFSIYNFYNRENAFSITFREKKDGDGNPTGETEAVKTTLFKIIPSVTWNFKF